MRNTKSFNVDSQRYGTSLFRKRNEKVFRVFTLICLQSVTLQSNNLKDSNLYVSACLRQSECNGQETVLLKMKHTCKLIVCIQKYWDIYDLFHQKYNDTQIQKELWQKTAIVLN